MGYSRLTHDDEEAAAFVPSYLASAAEDEGERVHCWVLELVETFHLKFLYQYVANFEAYCYFWRTVWPNARMP